MDSDELQELHTSVLERLDAAKIKYQDASDFDESMPIDLTVQFPNGRSTRSIFLMDEDDVETFSDIDFEQCTLVGAYAAVLNRQLGRVEAVLTTQQQARGLLRRPNVLKTLGGKEEEGKPSKLEVPSSQPGNPRVFIQTTTRETKFLTQTNDQLNLSICIIDSKLKTHELALEALERITNSLFFSIDLNLGLQLLLLRYGAPRRRGRAPRKDFSISQPSVEYDKAPMALYWYARSAEGMPLLQFLAYYQVIEFYYPVYFNVDANKRIRTILKHPTFRADRDADIAKLLTVLRANRAGGASERDFLKATLRECLSTGDIESFLREDPDRAQHYASKTKGVTSYTINPEGKQADLVQQVAERIYEIRCKIVHTRGETADGELDLLLPFSAEADRLYFDIELVKFASQQVLVVSSRPSPTAA